MMILTLRLRQRYISVLFSDMATLQQLVDQGTQVISVCRHRNGEGSFWNGVSALQWMHQSTRITANQRKLRLT